MNDYNANRTHSGKFCFGKTPLQTFIESVHLAKGHYLKKIAENPIKQGTVENETEKIENKNDDYQKNFVSLQNELEKSDNDPKIN